jgi:hypothetical protein
LTGAAGDELRPLAALTFDGVDGARQISKRTPAQPRLSIRAHCCCRAQQVDAGRTPPLIATLSIVVWQIIGDADDCLLRRVIVRAAAR